MANDLDHTMRMKYIKSEVRLFITQVAMRQWYCDLMQLLGELNLEVVREGGHWVC